MRLGLVLPIKNPDGSLLSGPELAAWAGRIEASGFDSIWLNHTLSRRGAHPDPLIWLAVAAASTRRIEIGTAILQVPLRRPVELAQSVLTLHGLTGGRLSLGVGAGSSNADFESLGLDFSQRFQLLTESLSLMHRLWQGEQAGDANIRPWPGTEGGPRLLLGSWTSDRWVRRAAEEFDGWMTSGANTGLNNLRDAIKRYRQFGGQRALVTSVRVDISGAHERFDPEGPFRLVCSAQEASDRLKQVADLGYDDVIVFNFDVNKLDLDKIRALVPMA
jgi:alkanesulfonate monooxygenase SsuD/methylene tetrahydromethanopterin reductase-like flavin-dependent oxidoreductase (luciferase family)